MDAVGEMIFELVTCVLYLAILVAAESRLSAVQRVLIRSLLTGVPRAVVMISVSQEWRHVTLRSLFAKQ